MKITGVALPGISRAFTQVADTANACPGFFDFLQKRYFSISLLCRKLLPLTEVAVDISTFFFNNGKRGEWARKIHFLWYYWKCTCFRPNPEQFEIRSDFMKRVGFFSWASDVTSMVDILALLTHWSKNNRICATTTIAVSKYSFHLRINYVHLWKYLWPYQMTKWCGRKFEIKMEVTGQGLSMLNPCYPFSSTMAEIRSLAIKNPAEITRQFFTFKCWPSFYMNFRSALFQRTLLHLLHNNNNTLTGHHGLYNYSGTGSIDFNVPCPRPTTAGICEERMYGICAVWMYAFENIFNYT